jgi:23S rRNA (uracil1939-C5)-methyltransferase
MAPGDQIELTIEKPVAGGRMLARHDGAVVLVSGALPRETVEARVERVQRGTAWAQVTRVMEPSPDRIGEPNPCGGCVWAHARYEAQLALKQQIVADAFARVARLPLDTLPAIEASAPTGYRMRARLHVRDGRVGFFKEGTHEVCDAASTGQLLPETAAVIDALQRGLASAPGIVTEIELSENRDGSERAVHLELARNADPSRLASLTTVEGVAGVSASHPSTSPRAGGHAPRSRELWGTPRVSDRFESERGSWTLERDARAFFQANRYLVEPLCRVVVGALGEGTVVDLYAGVGLFSVAAATAGHERVIAVEGDPVSSADLVKNARQAGGRITVHAHAVEDVLAGRNRPRDTGSLIVDPPRTGLSRAALTGAITLRARRLIYVSCDVATLARDARAIIDAGYQMASIRAFDLFPNTPHLESVAVFEIRNLP